MKLFCVTALLPIALLFLACSQGFAGGIDDLSVLTENFPPFNFENDGKLQGFSTDILERMFQTVGSRLTRKDFTVLPWSRAYQDVLEMKNTLLYSVSRTAQREHLFKWVGPIAANRNVLMARKDRNITIRSIEDIAKYTVGVIQDDAGEQLLVAAGVEKSKLDISSDAKSNILKLSSGRIDLFAYPETVTLWVIKSLGLNPDDYTGVYVLGEGEVYYALNHDSPDSVVKTLQDALDEMKRTGQVDEIIKRYK